MKWEDFGFGLLIAGISFGVGFIVVSLITQGLITIFEFPNTLIYLGDVIAPLSQIWYVFVKSVPPSLIAGLIAIPIGLITIGLMSR